MIATLTYWERGVKRSQPSELSIRSCAFPPDAVVSMHTCRSAMQSAAVGVPVSNGTIAPVRDANWFRKALKDGGITAVFMRACKTSHPHTPTLGVAKPF